MSHRAQAEWYDLLKAAHEERTGVGESVLQRAEAGGHTPYRWLARAVSARAALVLDEACGSGAMTRELATADRTVIGLDTRERELAEAARRSEGSWVCADARRLPFADDTFDAVTSALGLAVIHPTDAFIAEAARVLKPGGLLAMMAPALVPMNARDARTIAELSAILHARPRLPGVAHRAEIDVALAAHRLRRIELRRERYRFTVSSRSDAELIIHGLYLPARSASLKRRGVNHLMRGVEARGSVEVAIPLRRIVAIK